MNDTWEWDGVDWTLRSPLSKPAPRHHTSMVYDAARQRMLLFGGYAGLRSLGDTWSYGPLPFYGRFGGACVGTAGLPELDVGLPPRIGQPFSLRLSHAPPNQIGGVFLGFSREFWGPIPLPLDLSRIGLSGCSLFADIILAFPVYDTGPTGSVVWETTFVNDPAHVGVHFFNQAFFVDPGANPGGLAFTNAGHGVIGR